MTYNNFYDLNHAQRYLSNSLIRVRDKPAWVYDVNMGQNDYMLQYSYDYGPMERGEFVPENRMHTIEVRSPKVNLNPVPLGMINLQGKRKYDGEHMRYTTYTTRSPKRQWSVGLNGQTLEYFGPDRYIIIKYDHMMDHRTVLFSQGLRDCILNVYPSFRKVRAMLNKNEHTHSVAFSRRWALDKNSNLHYKWWKKTVGNVAKDGHIELSPEFQYLEQVLYEDIK